jgi:hypothetical protein
MPRLLYQWEGCPQCTLHRGLGATQRRSGLSGIRNPAVQILKEESLELIKIKVYISDKYGLWCLFQNVSRRGGGDSNVNCFRIAVAKFVPSFTECINQRRKFLRQSRSMKELLKMKRTSSRRKNGVF